MQYISTKKAAELCGVSDQTIRRLFDKKKIPGVRLDGKRLIDRELFFVYLRKHANSEEAKVNIR